METPHTISVEEMEDLIQRVNDFYVALGNPKMDIIWLADTIIKRVRKDRDLFLNLEGEKGSGKSNLALLLTLMICRYAGVYVNKQTQQKVKVLPRTKPMDKNLWERISVDFDFDKNMSFLDEADKVKQKFFSISKYSAFICDEGSKSLHKYQWQSNLQQTLIQMSNTERWQNKIFITCIPNFRELTATFRNDRVKLRLYIYTRHTKFGYASCIISMRDVNRWTADPWYIDENAKLFEYALKRTPASQRSWKHVLYAEKKLRGYAGVFDFPSLKELAPKIWNIYYRYKVENALNEKQDLDDVKEKAIVVKWKYATKMLTAFIQEKHPEINWTDLAALTNLTPATIKIVSKTQFDIEKEQDLRKKAVAIVNNEDNTQI